MQEAHLPPAQENISKAVISGMGLALVRPAWFAGTGLAGRSGIAAPPIKTPVLGVNFLNKLL